MRIESIITIVIIIVFIIINILYYWHYHYCFCYHYHHHSYHHHHQSYYSYYHIININIIISISTIIFSIIIIIIAVVITINIIIIILNIISTTSPAGLRPGHRHRDLPPDDLLLVPGGGAGRPRPPTPRGNNPRVHGEGVESSVERDKRRTEKGSFPRMLCGWGSCDVMCISYQIYLASYLIIFV